MESAFLNGEISEEDFFISLIICTNPQGPIPGDKSFNEKKGFKIRLLPSVLYLVDKVNQNGNKWEIDPGLSNDEFCIFVLF